MRDPRTGDQHVFDPVLAILLGTRLEALSAPATLDGFLPAYRDATAAVPDSIDRAAIGGFLADRVGFAFIGGYRAALDRTVPSLRGRAAAICVTEAGGNRPSAIETRLESDGGTSVISGHKVWSTAAASGEVLLVAASAGRRDNRNDIRVAVVDTDQPGVQMTPMPETPFVPEIPHYSVTFEAARVDRVLPGDGYARFIKPFRTVEDLHVSAALTGHLLAHATRAGVDRSVHAELLAALVGLRGLAGLDVGDPAGHIGLAGWLTAQRATLERLDDALWPHVDPAAVKRFRRDVPLLGIAGKARAVRLTRAWQAIATTDQTVG